MRGTVGPSCHDGGYVLMSQRCWRCARFAWPDYEVNAHDVRELRMRTGAGMAECERALQTCGDMSGAVEFLRCEGLAVVARCDRFEPV